MLLRFSLQVPLPVAQHPEQVSFRTQDTYCRFFSFLPVPNGCCMRDVLSNGTSPPPDKTRWCRQYERSPFCHSERSGAESKNPSACLSRHAPEIPRLYSG